MKWIKCSERLPEENIRVLVYMPKSSTDNEWYSVESMTRSIHFKGSRWTTHREITKWMPLPDGDNDEEQ